MNKRLLPGERWGCVRIPASKSQAHRLLILAALGREETRIVCDGISKDIAATVACLNALGADIRLAGQRAEIRGVERLHGAVLNATDLRGGASMIVAGLSAEGETLVRDEGHIRRGYEGLDQRLAELGAEIRLEQF